jgi:hypothetical protein
MRENSAHYWEQPVFEFSGYLRRIIFLGKIISRFSSPSPWDFNVI